jgi:hypothetical protein
LKLAIGAALPALDKSQVLAFGLIRGAFSKKSIDSDFVEKSGSVDSPWHFAKLRATHPLFRNHKWVRVETRHSPFVRNATLPAGENPAKARCLARGLCALAFA